MDLLNIMKLIRVCNILVDLHDVFQDERLHRTNISYVRVGRHHDQFLICARGVKEID